MTGRSHRTLEEKLIEKTKVDPKTGCWVWTAAKYDNGYGALRHQGKTTCAHRFSYETFVGPIPDDHEINHKCKNRACVNPDH